MLGSLRQPGNFALMACCIAGMLVGKGTPDFIRWDSGSGGAAHAARGLLGKAGGEMLFIKPCSPWENDCYESVNGKMRDESRAGNSSARLMRLWWG